MPRSCWLACGAVVGALALVADALAVLALTWGAVGASLILAMAFARERTMLIALALGAGTILARGMAMPAAAELTGVPTGAGPWQMLVESIGSPRDGKQVATLRTLDTEAVGFRVAASLPRYPQIEPGDRIEVGGRVRERPNSPYGLYLERIGAWGSLDATSITLLERPTDPGATLEGRLLHGRFAVLRRGKKTLAGATSPTLLTGSSGANARSRSSVETISFGECM